MKPRLSLEECNSLIQLIGSNNRENINLACQILLSKSYKTNLQLRTAIYRAECILRRRRYKNWEVEYTGFDINQCINALKRYKQKLIRYGN